jgi:hypothetical protein
MIFIREPGTQVEQFDLKQLEGKNFVALSLKVMFTLDEAPLEHQRSQHLYI